MLDRVQANHLNLKLRSRREVLRAEIRYAVRAAGRDPYGEPYGEVRDAGDESVADVLADVNLKCIDRDARELADIGLALERMARGSYGVCVNCGTEIDYARLRAQPTAERCIDCENRHEHQYARPQ